MAELMTFYQLTVHTVRGMTCDRMLIFMFCTASLQSDKSDLSNAEYKQCQTRKSSSAK